MSWVSDITTAITSTFTALGNGIIEFITSGFTKLFFVVDGTSGEITGVSNFGIFGFVLMGISLVLGLTYFIVNLVRRKI